MVAISSVRAREVLDSRGSPTVEVNVRLRDGSFGRASVPSGVSGGTRETVEIRDGDPFRFAGKGVTTAVANVNDVIGPALRGRGIPGQRQLDDVLIQLDGAPKKHHLGTVSEALRAMAIGTIARYENGVSSRSGDTADDFIGDFAVGASAGAPRRGERLTKHNQLLPVEEGLGTAGRYVGTAPFTIA